MAEMRVAQVPKAGADFEIAEREIPQPGTGEVNEAYARTMSGKAEFRRRSDDGGSSRAPRAPAVETVAGEQWPQERAARPGPAPMRDFSRPIHAVLTCPR